MDFALNNDDDNKNELLYVMWPFHEKVLFVCFSHSCIEQIKGIKLQ